VTTVVVADDQELVRSGLERPVIMIERTTQNDSIVSWKHVTAAQITVIHLRLRQEHF